MNPTILSIGTSLPPHSLPQNEIADYLIQQMQLQDEEAWLVKKIYENSAIKKRYSVLPDLIQTKEEFLGMSVRNAIYKKEAPLLAEKAAKKALESWKRPLSEITHVISVSCTGVITPGIEFILARQLDLDRHTSLLGINFMGCHGAFKALKVATKIANDHPKNRILLVCTELCTLHFKPGEELEKIVIQSLFADGSAAIVMGAQPQDHETALFEFEEEQSYAIPDSLDDMTWDASSEGFEMKLSPRVPGIINKHIEPFVQRLIGKANYKDFDWAVHPGGKAIIEAVEKALILDQSSTISSWNVLKNYGNLSSATFLFVLQDIYERKMAKEKIVGLGFGPGLCVEGLLIKSMY